MSTYHAIVWIDQSEAHVLSSDPEHVEAQKIRSRTHHKHQGRTTDDAAFFQDVYAALAGSKEVLLTGPGATREEFAKWAKKQHPDGVARFVGSVAADHPTDAQLVALGRRYFKGYDQMADDPARK
jgi:stalled ribosome rescue protein Dom34